LNHDYTEENEEDEVKKHFKFILFIVSVSSWFKKKNEQWAYVQVGGRN